MPCFDICSLHARECNSQGYFLLPPSPWTSDCPSSVPCPSHYMEENRTPWECMVGFSTDGAPSMAGRRNCLRTLITQLAPSAIWNHCMIHREQLACKELNVPIANILQQVVTMVNYIKPHPLCASVCNTVR